MKADDLKTRWKTLADKTLLDKTIQALASNGIDAIAVNSTQEAKNRVLELIPEGSKVLTMSSVTLMDTGIADEINSSGKFDSVREKLSALDRKTDGEKMNQMGAAPQWALGSVQAITDKGEVLIASNTGSQLPAYSYAATNVIWVVGTQKIVSNLDEGLKRIYDYVLPLEDERAQKAYGMGSNVSKMLIVNKEITPNRIKIIFVKEKLGY